MIHLSVYHSLLKVFCQLWSYLQIYQKLFLYKCGCCVINPVNWVFCWNVNGALNIFRWKITSCRFLKVSPLIQTLHTPHWPPPGINKRRMQSEKNYLSKLSLWVISGLKWSGNSVTPQIECWSWIWFFLCGLDRPSFSWKLQLMCCQWRTAQETRVWLRRNGAASPQLEHKYDNMGTAVYRKYCWF